MLLLIPVSEIPPPKIFVNILTKILTRPQLIPNPLLGQLVCSHCANEDAPSHQSNYAPTYD